MIHSLFSVLIIIYIWRNVVQSHISPLFCAEFAVNATIFAVCLHHALTHTEELSPRRNDW